MVRGNIFHSSNNHLAWYRVEYLVYDPTGIYALYRGISGLISSLDYSVFPAIQHIARFESVRHD